MALDKLVDSGQLDTDLTAIANAIRTKGGTSAQLAFPSEFVSAINAISGGGGGGGDESAEQKDVNFIDYDGKILFSYTKAEFANLTALPANPDHTGDDIPLTSQGWNWNLNQISTQLTAMPDDPVWVGQMYATDGKTYIVIELHNGRTSPYLSIGVNGSVTVNWGDNSTSTVTGSSLTTRKATNHAYSSPGKYVITISASSGNYYSFYGTSTYTVLNKNSGTQNQNIVYSNAVKAVRVGSNASLGEYSFYGCHSMETITLPSSITSIGQYSFYNCYSLRSITLPSDVTSIAAYTFAVCHSLESMSLPSGVTSIGDSAFRYTYALPTLTLPSGVTSIAQLAFNTCYNFARLTVPSGVTSIAANTFNTCSGLAKLRFLRTSPPTVGNSNAFTNIPTDCVISVPTGSLSAYKGATNYPSKNSYTYVEE